MLNFTVRYDAQDLELSYRAGTLHAKAFSQRPPCTVLSSLRASARFWNFGAESNRF